MRGSKWPDNVTGSEWLQEVPRTTTVLTLQDHYTRPSAASDRSQQETKVAKLLLFGRVFAEDFVINLLLVIAWFDGERSLKTGQHSLKYNGQESIQWKVFDWHWHYPRLRMDFLAIVIDN